jgi:crotonobetainyl-CoA:carnitine CoA-transferase CaiB-like acyl-CoA transferase
MVSISNFGQTGPNRNYEATDMVQYALGGLMYVIGSNGREPLKHALNQAQFKAGTNAAVAAVIAVFHQQLTGRGQMVDISIQESITAALRDTTSLYTYLGAIKRRHPDYVGDMPRSPVEVQDGFIVPVAYGGVDWDMMADFLDAPELTEERFSTPEGRLDNAREMGAVLGEALGRWKKEDLTRASRRRKGLLFGAVQSPADLYENPQYQARGYFAEIEHPVAGALTYPGAPFVMSRTPWRARTPAPTLGQHNQEVLCDELGHSVAELARLRAAGVT